MRLYVFIYSNVDLWRDYNSHIDFEQMINSLQQGIVLIETPEPTKARILKFDNIHIQQINELAQKLLESVLKTKNLNHKLVKEKVFFNLEQKEF